MSSFRSFGAAVGCLAALAAAACEIETRDVKTVTRSVELDAAASVAVDLEMGAGELHVAGGSAKLMDASFRFNHPSWEPVVDYQSADGHARLRVKQPDSSMSFGRTENSWDLRFNDALPIDLTTHLGAGQATIAAGTLNLRSLEIHHGAGELDLDLRGAPRQSYDVRVNGGVGSARIRVPRSVAIVATATGGIGDINVSGLAQRGDSWYNPDHANDPVVIRLDVKGGVGEVRISAE